MSDSEEEPDKGQQLKLVVLGDQNVGKTSLIRRFCYDEFTRQYLQTIGADFFIKRLVLPGKKEVTVRISDVGGQELNGHMLSNYLFNCDLIILVYDITNCLSFDQLHTWIEAVENSIQKDSPFLAVLGNKGDLEHKRAVSLDKTKNFANDFKLVNFLVSAKTGEAVHSSLMEVIAKYYGIPLTKVEKERQAPIVRAELIPASAEPCRRRLIVRRPSNTSVCNIQ